jgi:hypothetical protein
MQSVTYFTCGIRTSTWRPWVRNIYAHSVWRSCRMNYRTYEPEIHAVGNRWKIQSIWTVVCWVMTQYIVRGCYHLFGGCYYLSGGCYHLSGGCYHLSVGCYHLSRGTCCSHLLYFEKFVSPRDNWGCVLKLHVYWDIKPCRLVNRDISKNCSAYFFGAKQSNSDVRKCRPTTANIPEDLNIVSPHQQSTLPILG